MNVYDSWHRGYDLDRTVEEYFVDITHNPLGVLCRVYYNPRTKSYKFEPMTKEVISNGV